MYFIGKPVIRMAVHNFDPYLVKMSRQGIGAYVSRPFVQEHSNTQTFFDISF
jgi:hypothetical protein